MDKLMKKLREALVAAEADITDSAKIVGSRYDRKTKSYVFNDELFKASSPGSFAVVQKIRAALATIDTPKGNVIHWHGDNAPANVIASAQIRIGAAQNDRYYRVRGRVELD